MIMSDELKLDVEKQFCAECSLALRRFIGHMNGVEEVAVEKGHIVVRFDGEKVAKKDLFKISKDSIEKLGYKLENTEQ
jgi:copper chaperone CopZ